MSGLKVLLFLVIITTLIRLILVVFPSYKIDMNTWQAWTIRLVEVTPINFYSPDYFADYFPGYLYMLWFLGNSFNLIFPQISIISLGFETYLKLFTNLFDILTAFIIYKTITRYSKKWGLFSSILYLANPALTFNSSIMGQVDGILTFFLVYSTYYLLERKKPFEWSILSGLAFLVKPQGLAIFPISLIYLAKNFPKKYLLSILVIPILMIVLSVPFFVNNPLFGLFNLFQKSANTYPYTSMFSYNFWSFAGFWVSDSTAFLGTSYQYWGLVLFSLALLLIVIPLIRNVTKNQTTIYYLAFALSSMTFFMFLTRMHQRYLFPFFAFLLIFASIKKSVRLISIYLILSLVHLINLWYVYYYYNYVYPNPTFVPSPLFKFLESNYNLFTIINLIGFAYLILIYYSNLSQKNNAKEIS